MRSLKLLFCCALATLLATTTDAQGILRKIKNAADRATDKIIDKKTDEAIYGKDGNPANGTASTGSSGTGKAGNKGGGGLISTPPNVSENLTAAETAFKGGNYGDARYAVQQAMLGVELEIGQKILKTLPPTVAGLAKDTTADQVTSTGWGWAGLTIHREWGKDDKQVKLTVANNAVWMNAINMYFNNMGYAQTNNGEQKWKQIKVKGNRAVIEYDDNTGYKVSVPLGQTSLLVYEGINIGTEGDMMAAVNTIDIDMIKKHLGEK
ncbi:MAG TPA: hypothetical protein VM010_00780 [Chitinophagaceae bacterium]|nr:hypothetical protein [Chitinophagaceae bacterium]